MSWSLSTLALWDAQGPFQSISWVEAEYLPLWKAHVGASVLEGTTHHNPADGQVSPVVAGPIEPLAVDKR
jgi:hypothetical protein